MHASKVPDMVSRSIDGLLDNPDGYEDVYIITGGHLVPCAESSQNSGSRYYLVDEVLAEPLTRHCIELTFGNSLFDSWHKHTLDKILKDPRASTRWVFVGGIFLGRRSPNSVCQLRCFVVNPTTPGEDFRGEFGDTRLLAR